MADKKYWIYIENYEGALFRGPARGLPRERWDEEDKKWVDYDDGGGKPDGWGDKITPEEALKIMDL